MDDDDDTTNLNLDRDSQKGDDGEEECGHGTISSPFLVDETEEEEEAPNAESGVEAMKRLIAEAETEIDELEKDVVFLQIVQASAGREHWLHEFCSALRDHIEWLEIAFCGLRNNIMSPHEAKRRLYREPAEKLPVILKALMARYFP